MYEHNNILHKDLILLNYIAVETETTTMSQIPSAGIITLQSAYAYWTLQNPQDGTDTISYTHNFTNVGLTYDSGPGIQFSGVSGTFLYQIMSSANYLYFPSDSSLTFWLYPEATGGILQYTGISSTFSTVIG